MNNEKRETAETRLELLDGVIAAPEHHKVIFENERVRVVELKVEPGATVPVHTHRWATVNYVINPSNFLSFDAEGNLKLDSRTGKTDIKQGGVFYLPPFPEPHSVENIGTSEMHGIAVELKD